MSRLDVVRSLLRSAARSASHGIANVTGSNGMRRAIEELSFGLKSVTVRDAQLTAAVARVPEVSAATVSTGRGRMRVDVTFLDGEHLQMAVEPAGSAFAPLGAKELSFRVEPRELAHKAHCRAVLGAIAAEIARVLWRPALLRAPRSGEAAFVTSEHGLLVVDLRSVPEVRWAMQQRLYAAMIEVLRPRAIELGDGSLCLRIALEGLARR